MKHYLNDDDETWIEVAPIRAAGPPPLCLYEVDAKKYCGAPARHYIPTGGGCPLPLCTAHLIDRLESMSKDPKVWNLGLGSEPE